MKVQGQKNHYNVKLLKGYGVSIDRKGNHAYLKLRVGTNVIQTPD
jgi:hypothetical protein